MQIALKETAETEYWLRLLVLAEYITEEESKSLIDDCLEIKKILISTLNTSKAANDAANGAADAAKIRDNR